MTPAPSKELSGRMVHVLLAHSYLIYLASVVVGFGADLIWPVKFSFPSQQSFGIAFILVGTVLAVWAQNSSQRGASIRNAEVGNLEHNHFRIGPYMFTRTPTQYGLFFMTLGLSLLYGFTFMLITSVVAFLVGKFVFIKKEERHLANKYGEAYLEYKKRVKL